MKQAISTLFNWKKHPGNVFYLAVPLALLGFGLLGFRAYLEFKLRSDPVYAILFVVGVVVLAIALVPAWRMHQHTQRLSQLFPDRPDSPKVTH